MPFEKSKTSSHTILFSSKPNHFFLLQVNAGSINTEFQIKLDFSSVNPSD